MFKICEKFKKNKKPMNVQLGQFYQGLDFYNPQESNDVLCFIEIIEEDFRWLSFTEHYFDLVIYRYNRHTTSMKKEDFIKDYSHMSLMLESPEYCKNFINKFIITFEGTGRNRI